MTALEYIHHDERRFFAQVLTKPVRQINYYSAKRGAVLGNHYHKKTTEYFFLLDGKAIIRIDGVESPMEPLTVEVVRPMQNHAIKCVTNIRFMTFLTHVNIKDKLDVHELDKLKRRLSAVDRIYENLDIPLSKKCGKRK